MRRRRRAKPERGHRSQRNELDKAKMRRVVVTGMGIVSSIGNSTQEVLASLREAKSGVVRADKYAELGFRCHVHGAPTLDPGEVRRSPRHALSRRRCRLEPRRHGAGDPRLRPRTARSIGRAHRHGHGLGRAVDPHHRRGRRHRAHQGAEAHRPVRGAEGDVVDRFGDARDLVQDQGRRAIRSRRPARPRTTASAMPTS